MIRKNVPAIERVERLREREGKLVAVRICAILYRYNKKNFTLALCDQREG
jgi:hypothetical protein